MQDTGHVLVDNYGCGAAVRGEFERQIKSGERSFREVSNDMWGSLNIPFGDGFDVMEKTLTMDPGFKEFHHYCVENGFPFNVISAGLKPVLRRVLDSFLGEQDVRYSPKPSFRVDLPLTRALQSSAIEIVANDAVIPTDGSKWLPVWRHNVDSGIDKALSVDEGRAQAEAQCEPDEMPLIIFIGDGVSDLAAARQADVLFARQGLALEAYCLENKIPFIPFVSFVDIKHEIEKISREDQAKTGGVGKPVRYNPRANMWRRISSKEAVCSPAPFWKSKEKDLD